MITTNFVLSPRKKSPMPHHRPYRPQPPRIPADIIREDTCTRRCMNPLTGIWPACATVPGYRYASPNGEGYPAAILHSTFFILHLSYTFSAKERDSETGLSYFGSRYYSSDLSVWLSVDPMSDKYPSLSPYVYCADNPVRLVDPDGVENMYAFHYAQRYLLNKVGSVKDIERDSWYGYNQGQHSTLTKQIPTKESCYGVIWHAYMNSGDKITSYLQTGFSGKNNSFEGRTKSETWFKQGNDTPANEDGLSRSFETDIMKGEIGDIVFMNGHAAMLAGIPEQIEEDGNTYVKLKVFTSTSNSGFIEQDIVFDANNKNRTGGWSGFEGYGQLHQTQGKGNPDLE